MNRLQYKHHAPLLMVLVSWSDNEFKKIILTAYCPLITCIWTTFFFRVFYYTHAMCFKASQKYSNKDFTGRQLVFTGGQNDLI